MKKHPRTVEASFETSGTVGTVHVAVGDDIGEGQLLAELRQVRLQVDFDAAKTEYTSKKNEYAQLHKALKAAEDSETAEDELARIRTELSQAKEIMDAALQKVGELRATMDSAELLSPSKGEIQELRIATHSQVEAGEAVVVINPKDHFYLFNQSLAIVCFIAFWIFLALHFLAT